MRGFTMVELIMVLLVAGILAVYALPKFNFGGFQNTSARAELVQGIRYAQFQSLYHTGAPPYRIEIVHGGFSVTQSGAAVPDPANPSASYIRTHPGTNNNKAGFITFDGRGRPTCSNGLANCDTEDMIFTLTTGSDSSTVTVESYTGFAH